MSHIEVEKRYLRPVGVDMMKVMRPGWRQSRHNIVNILFDRTGAHQGEKWEIQKRNQTLRARCFLDPDLPLHLAAKTSVLDLISAESTIWTLKSPVKGEGKKEIEDVSEIAKHLLKLSDARVRKMTRADLADALERVGIVPFSTIFTHRNMFENEWDNDPTRPDVVTWDDSLCEHDAQAGNPARSIIEVETVVVLENSERKKETAKTKTAQAKNVAWAEQHLFAGQPGRIASGGSAMCLLTHMDVQDLKQIYACRPSKVKNLRNSLDAGEISQERIDELLEEGVIDRREWLSVA